MRNPYRASHPAARALLALAAASAVGLSAAPPTAEAQVRTGIVLNRGGVDNVGVYGDGYHDDSYYDNDADREAARAVRGQIDAAREQVRDAANRVRESFEANDEMLAAEAQFEDARARLEQARERVMAGIKDNPQYGAALDQQQRAESVVTAAQQANPPAVPQGTNATKAAAGIPTAANAPPSDRSLSPLEAAPQPIAGAAPLAAQRDRTGVSADIASLADQPGSGGTLADGPAPAGPAAATGTTGGHTPSATGGVRPADNIPAPPPPPAELAAAAKRKLDAATEVTALEQAALAADPQASEAQRALDDATDKLNRLQEKLDAVLVNDPGYRAAQDQLAAARGRLSGIGARY